nr:unnamed protein product [Callosobruchus chinensis]
MFNSGIKGSQRCNGLSQNASFQQISTNNKQIHPANSNRCKIASRGPHNNDKLRYRRSSKNGLLPNVDYNNIKVEPDDLGYKNHVTAHSIIGLGDINGKSKLSTTTTVEKQKIKKEDVATQHELLQWINFENDIYNHYQRHWFSAGLEKFKIEDRSREERIEITRHEFRRHIQQLVRSNVGQPNKFQEFFKQCVRNSSLNPKSKPYNSERQYRHLTAPRRCCVLDCGRQALPCAAHCSMHIMLNTEQVLFQYCTAKFADNTHCTTPVVDIQHELTLCREHIRKRDNYKLYQESKPKKLRKKVKPSAMIRPQKRNKKKRKLVNYANKSNIVPISATLLHRPSRSSPESVQNYESSEATEVIETDSPELEDIQIVDQVLGLNENGLEHPLETQTQLLEETDINTVLSTIQVDEFTDFFSGARNGEYGEPSREEAEELEKALAAVDNDVKSLEKLSASHGLLDPMMLDEHVLAETLVHLPEVFHNTGVTGCCGDNMVTQTTSYLMTVQPHSHS